MSPRGRCPFRRRGGVRVVGRRYLCASHELPFSLEGGGSLIFPRAWAGFRSRANAKLIHGSILPSRHGPLLGSPHFPCRSRCALLRDAPWSYFSASLLFRALGEFGALRHGCGWSTHVILGASPFSGPPPSAGITTEVNGGCGSNPSPRNGVRMLSYPNRSVSDSSPIAR
jgi:hypothetical protein